MMNFIQVSPMKVGQILRTSDFSSRVLKTTISGYSHTGSQPKIKGNPTPLKSTGTVVSPPAREDEPCVGDYILDFEYWTNIEGYEGVIDNVIVENGEVSYDVHKMFPYDHAFGAGIGHSNEIIKRQAILAFDSSLRDSYERCDCDDRKRQEKGKPPSWLQPEDNRGLGVLVGCIGVFIVVVAAALLLGLVLR
ncbi:MAG: hypothetical protein EBT18_09485 [Gammaproteobacteria bacterium]|nr:hypothetical protein [Gammaproteobacteria bacterium]